MDKHAAFVFGGILLVFAALGAVCWYRAGVQQAVWERQGCKMTQWEVFLGSKPIDRALLPVKDLP